MSFCECRIIAAPTVAKETCTQMIHRITGQYIGQTNRIAGVMRFYTIQTAPSRLQLARWYLHYGRS
jgi:hypothetical protein